jgi:hypothetical protein
LSGRKKVNAKNQTYVSFWGIASPYNLRLLNHARNIPRNDGGAHSKLITHTASSSKPAASNPLPEVDELIATETKTSEDSFVYVHCHFENKWQDMLIRIWKTSYLIDHSSEHRSKLVHVENISYAPQWTLVPNYGDYNFLLIFTSLPKSCTSFDLLEQISMPGGFHIKDIRRNETDVYHVNVF